MEHTHRVELAMLAGNCPYLISFWLTLVRKIVSLIRYIKEKLHPDFDDVRNSHHSLLIILLNTKLQVINMHDPHTPWNF